MVDTINPNTSEPDNWDNGQPATQPAATDNRFYGGFDKPDETKINLASSESDKPQEIPGAEAPVAEAPAPKQPISDVAAPVAPAEVKHTSYVNTADVINWRGVLVILAVGLIATLIVGAAIYFGVSAINNSKLAEQQASLDEIRAELTALNETPAALELPVTETPTVEEAPVVVPVTPPVETPIEETSEPVTPTSNG